jgi:hypothetical protein
MLQFPYFCVLLYTSLAKRTADEVINEYLCKTTTATSLPMLPLIDKQQQQQSSSS